MLVNDAFRNNFPCVKSFKQLFLNASKLSLKMLDFKENFETRKSESQQNTSLIKYKLKVVSHHIEKSLLDHFTLCDRLGGITMIHIYQLHPSATFDMQP
jgi:hypothetical protein